jgi:hypothetical protein
MSTPSEPSSQKDGLGASGYSVPDLTSKLVRHDQESSAADFLYESI